MSTPESGAEEQKDARWIKAGILVGAGGVAISSFFLGANIVQEKPSVPVILAEATVLLITSTVLVGSLNDYPAAIIREAQQQSIVDSE